MNAVFPMSPPRATGRRLSIAIIGSGISGMSAAWQLSTRHNVTVFEKNDRIGGHSNTREVEMPEGLVPVDTGFIVYNAPSYPNLTALFDHLGVTTTPSEMSFSVSAKGGRLEYSGSGLAGLLAQPSNAVRPQFWAMLRDIARFFKTAAADVAAGLEASVTLGDYLAAKGFSKGFLNDHLAPMAAAIWSSPAMSAADIPAAAFIRFFDNHGLLQFRDRPQWRTVVGGSRAYVDRLTARYRQATRVGIGARSVRRGPKGPCVIDSLGAEHRFDHVVLAGHADESLALLAAPTAAEQRLLGAFRYQENHMVLHGDPRLMPRRQRAWSSWNVLTAEAETGAEAVCVTYWMNKLQPLPTFSNLFVTLNPLRPPKNVIYTQTYTHPLFDVTAETARRSLWSLQGVGNLWYCGSYFGAGFHEDGLQSGLAVAEDVGGGRRPWAVDNESGRIHRTPLPAVAA
ncbi:MAG: NAD(P)/FAD-dependent oxidoreductase [Magnetospiraceae bacterium]